MRHVLTIRARVQSICICAMGREATKSGYIKRYVLPRLPSSEQASLTTGKHSVMFMCYKSFGAAVFDKVLELLKEVGSD